MTRLRKRNYLLQTYYTVPKAPKKNTKRYKRVKIRLPNKREVWMQISP